MPSRPAALRALETDTIDGHGQMVYEGSTDPKTMEARGRSMRVKMPSWRMQEERESEEPASFLEYTARPVYY